MQQIIDAIRASHEAFNRGEIGSHMDHIHPDVEWIEPPEFVAGGNYRGHSGVVDYLKRAKGAWAEATSEPTDFVTVGNRVMVIVRARVRAESDAEPVEATIADVYTVEDGLVTRMQAFSSIGEARTELGLVAGRGSDAAT